MCSEREPVESATTHRWPVILDTDIGDGIDDLWALAFLLGRPELELKLILTSGGNAEQQLLRAQVVAKFLAAADASHVPIGIGSSGEAISCAHVGSYFAWAADYDLARHPGGVLSCGVSRMVELAKHEEIILLAIGSATNIAAALDEDGESFVQRVHVIGQFGRFNGELGGYNVSIDLPAFQKLLTAPFALLPTIVPFGIMNQLMFSADCKDRDTLREMYRRLRNSSRSSVKAILECDTLYHKRELEDGPEWYLQCRPDGVSDPSVLGDAVLVWLAVHMLSGMDLVQQEAVPAKLPAGGVGKEAGDGDAEPLERTQRMVRLCRCWNELERARDMFWCDFVGSLDPEVLKDPS